MIAFIDCYIEKPANICVNTFAEKNNLPVTYHQVSHYGLTSLKALKTKPTAIIILGSASHVTDELPWHTQLSDYIDKSLGAGIPTLGICFGHQLMARFYGCKIGYIDQEQRPYKQEIREVIMTSDLLGFEKYHKLNLAYAHSQIIVELNESFIEIGKSEIFNNEVIAHKKLPFIGIQAHPEASENFLLNTANQKDIDKNVLNNGQEFLLKFYKYAQSIKRDSKNT